MVVRRNLFIDDDDLSGESSLIHLLNSHDGEDNVEAPILKHSPYYSEQQFASLLTSQNGLSILNLNICNVFTKFDELESFVCRVNVANPISVICLNECWLSERSDVSMIHLQNYKMVYQVGTCAGHSHCGLIIYVHDQFNCNEINITQATVGWEYLCVEISHHKPRSKKYIICNMYRPPERNIEELDAFIEQFSCFLNTLKNTNRPCFVNGDFNINILDCKSNNRVAEYFERVLAKGFFPRITLPTRIQPPSITLIDNIFTNYIQENFSSKSGVLINDISDHKMVFTFQANRSYKQDHDKYIDIEKTDELSLKKFMDELKSLNIYDKMNTDNECDPNENYQLFARLITYAREKHLLKRNVKFNKKKHKICKWMTHGILQSINTKNKLYKTFIQTDFDTPLYHRLKNEYIRFRATLRKSIRLAKQMYYMKVFDTFKNDIKKTWSVINDTMNRTTRNTVQNEFIVDDQRITDPETIADKFNEYFVNIGKSLSNAIQPAKDYTQYLNNEATSHFCFQMVNESSISDIIKKRLKNKSSYGVDGLSNKLIKHANEVINKPLSLIINQSLSTGIFPAELKLSRVKPLFKKGDKCLLSNYRPISLLPSISKLFEYVVLDQLLCYMKLNNLLCCEQFGFRPGYSTELAAIRLVDHLIQQMDANNIPINIYIDLSKAFDTLDHSILLAKLKHYGIRDRENKFFASYLTQRYQYVEFNGSISGALPISTGVPQGSILGPLLFLIYINDLPSVSTLFHMLMYADDTTLYCNVNENVSEFEINFELTKVGDWLASNKLSLNTSKTKYMVFHTARRLIQYPNLKINNYKIEHVDEFNFLGLILSSDLKWHKHVNHISLKITKVVGIMYRLKHIYPRAILLTLYNALILSHFNYCLLVWGSKVIENHKLHLIQKKALRIITNSDYIAHTEPICKQLRLLKVPDMFRISIWKFYFKLMTNKLPAYFSHMKPALPYICNRYEIRRPTFHLPLIRHEFAEHMLKYCLVNIINNEHGSLLITAKVFTHSFCGFKLYIKNAVIDAYNDQCEQINCNACRRLAQLRLARL